ncbi:MAG: DUF1642 domain-containing protein [Catonella sp.]|nr:MAG: DUF1642 domain-containing protein [Catonella sp.]
MSTIKSIKDFIKEVETDSETMKKWKDNCLEYLETLKPIVPNAVADWYDKLTYRRAPVILGLYENELSGMPDSVREWIDSLGDDRRMVLYDISRFGYRIEKNLRLIIMTSSSMLMANNYYVVKKGDKAYQLTTDIKNATARPAYMTIRN